MKEMICRLCLQTIGDNNCQPVEESLWKSLRLNINISRENVMCIECAKCLRVFPNGVKLEPEAIETTTNLKSHMETETKCSFCAKAHGREDLISLEESKENKFMVNILERYILDKNLKNAEELLACETCLESLEGVSSVVLKCVEVEKRISKFIKLEGTDDKGQVELKDIQQFMFGPVVKSEIGVNALEDRPDRVQEYTKMAESEIKCEREINDTELIIKTEDDDITLEQSDCDIPDIKTEESDCDGFQERFSVNKTPNDPLHKNTFGMAIFKCELCSYETKWKSSLKRHLLVHKSPSEIKMFKCELCSYEAKQKSYLKSHLLTHKSSSEIKTFQCELCSYESREKSKLKRHSLTHKSPSEMKTFQCELCSYVATHKSHLKTHLLIHKNPEIKMFKCELCSYLAKQKRHLKRHLLIHRNPSEIKMFKCGSCSYEAKQKVHLKTHLLTIHRNPSEIKMFKCGLCSYETNRKRNLKRHLLTHKSPSEMNKLSRPKIVKPGPVSY